VLEVFGLKILNNINLDIVIGVKDLENLTGLKIYLDLREYYQKVTRKEER
jgi:dihydroneopterin aldolase